jgi:hypothetical protein
MEVDKMIENAIKYLNELLEADRETISKIFLCRYPCNESLTNNPNLLTGEGGVRVFGIINGMFGLTDSNKGQITAEVDTNTNLINEFYKTQTN